MSILTLKLADNIYHLRILVDTMLHVAGDFTHPLILRQTYKVYICITIKFPTVFK